MKIKNVSCDQFAGIRNQDVSFEDGINIIYGKNESGKSTLVNLISRTLFHNAKGRSDKTFFEEYLPCSRKNSNIELKDIDGKIILTELTFTPGGALIPFEPVSADRTLGDKLDIRDLISKK